jgi:hypothetical protein
MPATTMPTALLFRKVARSLIFSVSAVLPKIAPYRLEILRILADRNCLRVARLDQRVGRREVVGGVGDAPLPTVALRTPKPQQEGL